VDGELSSMRRALEPLADKVEMDVLESARRDELLSRLRQGYHVLHFIGHGMFDRGEGYLILEDGEGMADKMSASLVGKVVADSNLRLVVLNACETSMAGLKNAFGGVAHQLVRAGMPAVVAMQLSIADRSAVAFSREFYGALADGWPVDAAAQEGRRSIMTALGNQWNRYVDWAIPTLYMRAPDGVILGV
jgi:CHAT domain-containing protein